MSILKEDFKCPNCKKKNRVKMIKECDNENIISIINRDIFSFVCSSCGEKIIIDHPLKLIGENYIIHYTPASDENIKDQKKEFMRVCDTFEDFKEKILIFEDNLNDIIIEFIKKFLLNQLEENIKNEVTDIRYDGNNEENLIFYLCGLKKSVGCSKSFYQELLNKSKIKKIDKCINIDSNTFSDYFKLR